MDLMLEIRQLPKWQRNLIGVIGGAVLAHYLTLIVLLAMGQGYAPLLDLIGLGLSSSILCISGAIGVWLRRPVFVNILFAGIGLVYILYALRHAPWSLAVLRQYVFYTLPFLLDGVMLMFWMKATSPESQPSSRGWRAG